MTLLSSLSEAEANIHSLKRTIAESSEPVTLPMAVMNEGECETIASSDITLQRQLALLEVKYSKASQELSILKMELTVTQERVESLNNVNSSLTKKHNALRI